MTSWRRGAGSRLHALVPSGPGLIAAFLAGGCDALPRGGPVAADSGGVEIVESSRPQWRGKAVWRIATEPTRVLHVPTEVQGRAGPTSPIADAARLPDGRILVADQVRGRIHVYGDGPDPIDSIGNGRGTGSGQFETLVSIWPLGDGRLRAFDSMGRWTTFLRDGSVESVVYLEPKGGWSQAYPARSGAHVEVSMRLPPGAGAFVRTLGHFDESGRYRTGIRFEPRTPVTLSTPDGDRQIRPFPFPGESFAADPEGLIATSGRRMEFLAYGHDGTLRRIVRVPGFDLSIDDATRSRLIARLEERYGSLLSESGRTAASLVGEHRPAISRLLLDPAGRVWACEANLLDVRGLSRVWHVFEADGTWLGPVLFPRGLDPLEIGEDRVLARTSRPSIRLYELAIRRGDGAGS